MVRYPFGITCLYRSRSTSTARYILCLYFISGITYLLTSTLFKRTSEVIPLNTHSPFQRNSLDSPHLWIDLDAPTSTPTSPRIDLLTHTRLRTPILVHTTLLRLFSGPVDLPSLVPLVPGTPPTSPTSPPLRPSFWEGPGTSCESPRVPPPWGLHNMKALLHHPLFTLTVESKPEAYVMSPGLPPGLVRSLFHYTYLPLSVLTVKNPPLLSNELLPNTPLSFPPLGGPTEDPRLNPRTHRLP